MGMCYSPILLQLELWKKGLYKEVNSVIDMGAQELHVNYESFKNLMAAYSLPVNSEFDNLQNYPGWPRLSAKAFYSALGIKDYVCVDLGSDHGAIKVDLNYPLEDKALFNKFDLVTDFGNNEHPFNVCEAYRTMHRLCKPGGLMIIDQALFGGNGFYNFDVGFFESMAAANNYEILFSAYNLPLKSEPGLATHIPLVPELLNLFDWSKIGYIGLTYVFRKKEDKDFCMAYQGGYQFERGKIYKPSGMLYMLSASKTYLPSTLSLANWSVSELIKDVFKRIYLRFLFKLSLKR